MHFTENRRHYKIAGVLLIAVLVPLVDHRKIKEKFIMGIKNSCN